MADLILINGLPGTGKTTLASKLTVDLGLPCLGKDMLKEFFFDTIGVGGRDDSRLLGKAVSEMLYMLAANYAEANRSLILESAYFAEFARPAFQKIADTHPVRILEIYCQTEKDIRRERFRLRGDSGQRHPGHFDYTLYSDLEPHVPEPIEVYAPMGIGKVINVDTTNFGNVEYKQLLRQVKAYIQNGEMQ